MVTNILLVADSVVNYFMNGGTNVQLTQLIIVAALGANPVRQEDIQEVILRIGPNTDAREAGMAENGR
jgi:hypothetical protein